jgi:hypothetical protein
MLLNLVDTYTSNNNKTIEDTVFSVLYNVPLWERSENVTVLLLIYHSFQLELTFISGKKGLYFWN